MAAQLPFITQDDPSYLYQMGYQMDAVPELGTFFIFARASAGFTVYRNLVPDFSVLVIWILTSVWVLVLVWLYTKGHKLYSQ